MTRDSLGNYFIKDGEIYYCNAYTDQPTVNLKNIRTGENETIVCSSDLAKKFNLLCEAPFKDGIYNLDKAMVVDRIYLNDKEGE